MKNRAHLTRSGSALAGGALVLVAIVSPAPSWSAPSWSASTDAAPLASISGTVVNQDGEPVGRTCVEVLDDDAARVGSGYVDLDGTYTAAGLPAGTYRLHLRACNDTNPNNRVVVGEWYQDQDGFESATPVVLADGEERDDVDWVVEADVTAPPVRITEGPRNGAFVEQGTVRFGFASAESDVTFRCTIAGRREQSCASPQTFDVPDPGRTTFAVRSFDAANNGSVARYRTFTVATPRCVRDHDRLIAARASVTRLGARLHRLREARRDASGQQRQRLTRRIERVSDRRAQARDRRGAAAHAVTASCPKQ